MVNVPEATAFCNIVNVPEDRSRRNQCISDAKPKCAQTAAEETNAFRRDQVCRTAAEETNAFQMCKFFRVHGKAQDYQDAL